MSDGAKYILLAEDDPVVAELFCHALSSGGSPPRIVHVRDGVETLDYLYARKQFEHRETANPAIILLDVKMPKVDGLEVLRQVRDDAQLKHTPIVMLTSSQDDRDVTASYRLGANAYVVKPVEARRFATVVRQIEEFWLKVNVPPPVGCVAPASLPPLA